MLERFALRLLETGKAPRQIARYLVGALRNEARKLHRDERRRERRYEQASGEPGNAGVRIVAESYSEYGVRSSRGDTEDDDSADETRSIDVRPSAACRFADLLVRDLGTEDRSLLVGISRGVPIRVLAQHLEVEYGTARVRVHRLRQRLRERALRTVAELEGDDRREMERFFRRAGVTLEVTPGAMEKETR